MNHPTELHYDARLAEAASLHPSEADYHALDQSEYGTKLRHEAVVNNVPKLDGHVLDLGCGTGLILEKMIEKGKKPAYYHGVDGMPEREKPLYARLQRLGVRGVFEHKPWDESFEELPLPRCDAALFVGVMGYCGYHTNRSAKAIRNQMMRAAVHGAITFPMIWGPSEMGGGYLRRWDPTDILDLYGPLTNNIVTLEREFVIYW